MNVETSLNISTPSVPDLNFTSLSTLNIRQSGLLPVNTNDENINNEAVENLNVRQSNLSNVTSASHRVSSQNLPEPEPLRRSRQNPPVPPKPTARNYATQSSLESNHSRISNDLYDVPKCQISAPTMQLYDTLRSEPDRQIDEPGPSRIIEEVVETEQSDEIPEVAENSLYANTVSPSSRSARIEIEGTKYYQLLGKPRPVTAIDCPTNSSNGSTIVENLPEVPSFPPPPPPLPPRNSLQENLEPDAYYRGPLDSSKMSIIEIQALTLRQEMDITNGIRILLSHHVAKGLILVDLKGSVW